MTYWQFHLLFTIPLFCVMVFISRNNPFANTNKAKAGMALLLFLAITYTTPWDSYLIHQNIWSYEPGRVLGTLFKIPFEEYFFFFVQTLVGCCFTAWVLQKNKASKDHALKISPLHLGSLFIALAMTAVLALTWPQSADLRYLALIVFWALPILFLQWSLGLPILLKEKKVWMISVTALTTYFCIADSIAVQQEIWTFPAETISGWKLFNLLPVEEALFFLVTNLMVVQGFILFTTVDFAKFQWTGFRRLKSL